MWVDRPMSIACFFDYSPGHSGTWGVLNLLITIRVVIAKSSWSKLPLHAANLYGTAQAQGGRAGIGIKALEETVAYAPHTLIELASQFQ
ncbi:hypothetical protein POX_a00144 [Penicillium oxalicum]|uniref:hypothetical protein n=1 Tax=Penicillium oxalicum TaxID=69781 RepID=UPI0020B80ABC|nr:hypothetical protein POX_a00144 [Penicillium oxalicum]KAI2793563.1 hypothetical protein POX_a00144 [Penicillium oxalicum]